MTQLIISYNPQPTNTVLSVISPQFCVPQPLDLVIRKQVLNITSGNFDVNDTNGNLVLKVKGLLFPGRRVILDDAGNPIVTLQRKILTAHDRWEVFQGDSTDYDDMIFSAKKSSIIQLKTELDVYLANNINEHVSDFKVKGSWLEQSCTIYAGESNTILAQPNFRPPYPYAASNESSNPYPLPGGQAPYPPPYALPPGQAPYPPPPFQAPYALPPGQAPYGAVVPAPGQEPYSSTPISVVGPEFCTPYPLDLVIANKLLSSRKFSVKDINGNSMYKVKGKLFSLHAKKVLLDCAGNTIVTFTKKIRTMHNRWHAFKGKSTDSKDLLFTVKKSSLIQFKTKLDVFLANNTKEEVSDFQVKGSWSEYSCCIYLGESSTIVAQMHKHETVQSVVLGKDSFMVTVYPNIDHAFIIALIIILNEINGGGGGNDDDDSDSSEDGDDEEEEEEEEEDDEEEEEEEDDE